LNVLDLARRLVAIESVSSLSNEPIAELLSQFCEDAGCTISRFPYNAGQQRQINIVASKGGSEPYFALSGHTDTVGYSANKWSQKPLELTRAKKKGGYVYFGLGIADMKLALATSIVAVASVSTRELKKPVGLYLTAQEEVGCIGAKRLVSSKAPIAPYVIVCEPTEMAVADRHKGYIYFSISVSRNHDKHDQSARMWAHSSDDRKNTNIIEVILPLVLRELTAIKDHLRTIADPLFDPSYTTINVGVVGQPIGATKNVIPAAFTLHCDARPIPSMDHDMLLRLIEKRVADTVNSYRSPFLGETFTTEVKRQRKTTPFFQLEDIDPSFHSALGSPRMGYVPYNTEARIFADAGSQVVIMGPGSIWDAHHEDECVSERWVQPDVTERYISAIRAMCG